MPLRKRCGFGIIFETDVDERGAVLPSDGGVIALDRNRLIALMTAILVRQYGPITVVTDSITSTGLTDFINSLGCRHHRFKRGYRNVINEAKRLLALEEAAKNAKEETDAEFANAILADAEFANAILADAIFANAIFAMETSGHGALRENYFLDDGAYIIVKLLVALVEARREGKTLNELIANLKEPCESAEARLNVLLDDTADYTAAVLKLMEKHFSNLPGFEIVQPNYEGSPRECGRNARKRLVPCSPQPARSAHALQYRKQFRGRNASYCGGALQCAQSFRQTGT